MSEERTNMAIRDLKHYVIDNMSLDVQDDFEIIYKYIKDLQQKVEQLEDIRKEAIEYINKNKIIDRVITSSGFKETIKIYELNCNADELLNILNKGSDKE